MARLPATELLAAIDAVDDLVYSARSVPLTGQVRVEREDLRLAVSRVREAVSVEVGRLGGAREFLSALETLERLVERAQAIPLTSQIRCDREKIHWQLDQMRRALPESVRQAEWQSLEEQAIARHGQAEGRRIIERAKRASDARQEFLDLVDQVIDPLLSATPGKAGGVKVDHTKLSATLEQLRGLVARAIDPELQDRDERIRVALEGLDEASRLLERTRGGSWQSEARINAHDAGAIVDTIQDKSLAATLGLDLPS